jgi:hypothetical protein
LNTFAVSVLLVAALYTTITYKLLILPVLQ